MIFTNEEIKAFEDIWKGIGQLPEDVISASEETLLDIAGFVERYNPHISVGAKNFLWLQFLPQVISSFKPFAYITTYPQYAFPLGYDEFRWASPGEVFGEGYLRDILNTVKGPMEFMNIPLPHFRRIESGTWDLFHPQLGFANLSPEFCSDPIGRNYEKLLEKLKEYQECPQTFAVVFPQLWTPYAGIKSIEMLDTVKEILKAIYSEKKDLQDVHWRTLEEIVAELLRSRGLAVHVTPSSADGGRDVIARGELMPGEPSLLAVEVKHKRAVKIGDLRAALWANKSFPMLLLATSGRFSAGVICEKKKPENAFRLILKDGLTLKQWINAYGCDMGWPKKGNV